MKSLKVLKFIGFGILGAAVAYLFVLLTMHLWNWLIPSLFAGPALSFWQTAGLLILSKIFFSGFGCHGRHARCHHRHFHEHCCNEHEGGRESWWKKFHDRCHCKQNDTSEGSCC